jgi:hypothetical protein
MAITNEPQSVLSCLSEYNIGCNSLKNNIKLIIHEPAVKWQQHHKQRCLAYYTTVTKFEAVDSLRSVLERLRDGVRS